jgi:hypothetical protein
MPKLGFRAWTPKKRSERNPTTLERVPGVFRRDTDTGEFNKVI